MPDCQGFEFSCPLARRRDEESRSLASLGMTKGRVVIGVEWEPEDSRMGTWGDLRTDGMFPSFLCSEECLPGLTRCQYERFCGDAEFEMLRAGSHGPFGAGVQDDVF